MPVVEWVDDQGRPKHLLSSFRNRIQPHFYQQIVDYGPVKEEVKRTGIPARELWLAEGVRYPSSAARKWEAASIWNERRKMGDVDFWAQYARACEKASAHRSPNAEFRPGQSVHQWWAPWFRTAETLPANIGGRAFKRPAWFFGEVLLALGKYPIRYAGRIYCLLYTSPSPRD